MIFTSITFFVFFAVVLVLMRVIPSTRGRIWMLLVASYLFYGNWNAHYVLLIFMYGVCGWALGLAIHNAPTAVRKKQYLWLSVLLCFGALAYFKYANFLGENISKLVGTAGWRELDVVLPVGISFFTFHTMSYLIDLYRGKIEPSRDPVKFLLFVSFFPQLVAGPILRASNFLPQLDRDLRLEWRNFRIGAQLFLGGAIQKALFADHLSIFVDHVYRDPGLYSAGTLWLAVAAYSMQIFCDFSGYSLMAIGTAKILGVDLPDNFRMPYLARSVADFWHRWHISLSTWLRDYLYIPLGGSRLGPTRTQVNMFITMLLGGLWHGASWNFVLWGALHGVALGVHRSWSMWRARKGDPAEQGSAMSVAAGWLATLLFCCIAWIPFRSPSIETTGVFLTGLVPGRGGVSWLHEPTLLILGAAVLWHALWQFAPKVVDRVPFSEEDLRKWRTMLLIGFAILLLILLVPLNTQPFIYFQF
jgi:alginate O-acetyltransferase complex protein AlgI